MAIGKLSGTAKMVLDYGQPFGRYTVNALKPDAENDGVYTLYQAIRSLQGDKPADVYFQVDSVLGETD